MQVAPSAMFVDWIKCSQYHGPDTPEFVGSLRFGLDDFGEVKYETGQPRKVEGSWSSSVQVASHGGFVRFSGNVSRFDRPDNLFGFELDECMRRINQLMAKLGLPAFTQGRRIQVLDAPGEGSKPLRLVAPDEDLGAVQDQWTGCRFSQLDLTRNYSAGSDFLAKLAIRSYQAKGRSRMKKGSYGEETVMWNNTHRTVKAYRKGPDMAVHCPESPWIEWANESGIVRQELSLRYRELSKLGLCYWGNCDMGRLIELFERETAFLAEPDCSLDPMAVECCPAKSRVIYAAWLKGEDVRSMLSRATFFRHKKVIQETCQVDIGEVRPRADVVPIVRVVELRAAEAPAGYWQQVAA